MICFSERFTIPAVSFSLFHAFRFYTDEMVVFRTEMQATWSFSCQVTSSADALPTFNALLNLIICANNPCDVMILINVTFFDP